jgi:hypothetical protein
MDDGWRVSFGDDEILLEYRQFGRTEIVIGIEDHGSGYAFLKDGQFSPGGCDLNGDLAGAIREIKDYISCAEQRS